MPHHVYIVECSDGTYYCGYTNNLDARIDDHNNSKTGASYTRSRMPVRLVYSKIFYSKSKAMKREFEIKKLTKVKKTALIENNV